MSVFAEISDDRIIHKGKSFFIIKDKYPVSPGHLLIISNEQKRDYFELNQAELQELTNLIIIGKELIEKEFDPQGYNIGMNCGAVAGQTVIHFHCHLIPRYSGDMADPRGGVRHCVEGKGYYNF
ncbi:Diadenosine tetraphosphate (Ap4A) hydrolase [Salinimicrobium catena]|uniref:Diadenosine tetraphosphate (Ap4A) hydrolase n=1 Tax=Salinimicrobium catena TaxID=390640 RepID=A0A1H5N5Q3_9FLAO|nr:HIT family protein [Salinimicrobium catena]SDL36153.1 Diadenosine tetraphosphate (Ap4A) hydrolase [Salinimicrobium catena]SEE96227.1 Diadenosine tetraphosphate (Ap4A) hydrolase [Salinimicrobium catena]